uniref:Uncharacterized protein n=1 Tax=Aureoumbra lagunensis TaxID=44058 RepID=A0A7S3JQ51_9STRA
MNPPRGRGTDLTKPAWLKEREKVEHASMPEQVLNSRQPVGAGRGRGQTLPAWMKDPEKKAVATQLQGLPTSQQTHGLIGTGRGFERVIPSWMKDESIQEQSEALYNNERREFPKPSRMTPYNTSSHSVPPVRGRQISYPYNTQQSQDEDLEEPQMLRSMVDNLISETAAAAEAKESKFLGRMSEIIPPHAVRPPSRRPPSETMYQSSARGPPARRHPPPSRAPRYSTIQPRYPNFPSSRNSSLDTIEAGPYYQSPPAHAPRGAPPPWRVPPPSRAPRFIEDNLHGSSTSDRPTKMLRRDENGSAAHQPNHNISDNLAPEDFGYETQWRESVRSIQNAGYTAYKNKEYDRARDEFEDALDQHARHCRHNATHFQNSGNRVPSRIHVERDKVRVKLLNFLARTLELMGVSSNFYLHLHFFFAGP